MHEVGGNANRERVRVSVRVRVDFVCTGVCWLGSWDPLFFQKQRYLKFNLESVPSVACDVTNRRKY